MAAKYVIVMILAHFRVFAFKKLPGIVFLFHVFLFLFLLYRWSWNKVYDNLRWRADKIGRPRAGIEPTNIRFYQWCSATELPRQLLQDGSILLQTDFQASATEPLGLGIPNAATTVRLFLLPVFEYALSELLSKLITKLFFNMQPI